MRNIDIQTWRRQNISEPITHHPTHTSACAQISTLTRFYSAAKQSGTTFTVAVIYALSRTANAIPEFRYRIRGDSVVEHEVVHPSTTIMGQDDLFTFCSIEYTPEFTAFAARAAERIAYVRKNPTLRDEPGRDDYLFMTSIPWVSFTAFTHPGHLHPAKSIPMFAWGKLFAEGDHRKMPLCVQVHHAVVDGVHVGRFYEQLQEFLQQPELILSKSE